MEGHNKTKRDRPPIEIENLEDAEVIRQIFLPERLNKYSNCKTDVAYAIESPVWPYGQTAPLLKGGIQA